MKEHKSVKRRYGQFFTTTNPFYLDVFRMWFESIPENHKDLILEPFAGANNIVSMVHEVGFTHRWSCYDINPSEVSSFTEYEVETRDTLKDFPKGHHVGITNPPYLAKNSATRRGLSYPDTSHDDVYKYALELMLDNLDYVACIIPESFITQKLFHSRLYAVISLTDKMFDDTDCPVCLALFNKDKTADFLVYRQNQLISSYAEIEKHIIVSEDKEVRWRFNDRNGSVGLKCVDNTKRASIEFIPGELIDASDVKPSSRAITRIDGLPETMDLPDFIRRCNELLFEYRTQTEDVFLTPFKGLREDDRYRRRLDFRTARNIMNAAIKGMA